MTRHLSFRSGNPALNKNTFKVSVMIDLSDYLDHKSFNNLDKLFNAKYRKYF